MSRTKLRIGEVFLSIQGEGASVGALSIFVRTTGCTLDCRWCDSVAVWKTKGVEYTPKQLATYVRSTYDGAVQARAHLILTGGSPLMQQELLAEFLTELNMCTGPIEVETEGVLIPSSNFDKHIWRYNVSPKLANSGMATTKRYRPEVLNWHAHQSYSRSIFKFVVSCYSNVIEVTDMQLDLSLKPSDIWLMPEASTRSAYADLAPKVVGWAKQHGYNFSPRLHISLYDQTTGV